MIQSHVGPGGSLQNEGFARAMLQYRNMPDRDTNCSPAQVVFGRSVRDFIPGQPGQYIPNPDWILMREMREKALSHRHGAKEETLLTGTKCLDPLCVGDIIMVQNQKGKHAVKWEKSGVVVEVMSHDQYLIKLDGSGRLTRQNRRFLKKFVLYNNVGVNVQLESDVVPICAPCVTDVPSSDPQEM